MRPRIAFSRATLPKKADARTQTEGKQNALRKLGETDWTLPLHSPLSASAATCFFSVTRFVSVSNECYFRKSDHEQKPQGWAGFRASKNY
jgi:hypothetical protein